MNCKSVVLSILALATCAVAAETAPRKPKALLIMLDGWRADTLGSACMPNLERLRKNAWQPGYNCAWSVTGLNLFDAITVSAPNHAAILARSPDQERFRQACKDAP